MQDEKSQRQNREKGMRVLRARLLETGEDWELLREGALSVAEVAARLDVD
ncbi:MAG: hypothetical protein ACXWZ3_08005 [Solirubrobacterales bacterium]